MKPLRLIILPMLWVLTLILETATVTASARPNFLVIISDDQRPDTIGALGNPIIRTPTLDALVRQGTTFSRATCANPHCVPSRAEILTGTTGFRNGVLQANGKLSSDISFWADTMRRAGYRTWYCGKWMNDGTPGTRGYERTRGLFSSGGSGGQPNHHRTDHKGAPVTGYNGWTFKHEDGKPDLEKGIGLTPEASRHIADAAIEALGATDASPFFLHINFTAPHDPLLPPPGFMERLPSLHVPVPDNFLARHPFDHGNARGRDELLLPFPRTVEAVSSELAAYYAVIEDMDRQIFRILQALDDSGRHAETVIIFSSDHGLAVGSHGLMGKQNQYEHTIGVPLIFAGPQIPSNRTATAQCHLRDLFPTTCALAALPIPESVTGRSLVPALRDQGGEVYPFAFGYWQDVQRMVRSSQHKLIAYPKIARWQMFDLIADPAEQHDLLASKASINASHREIFKALRTELIHWLTAESDPLIEELHTIPDP